MKKHLYAAIAVAIGTTVAFAEKPAMPGNATRDGIPAAVQQSQNKPVNEMVKPAGTWTNPAGKEITNHGMIQSGKAVAPEATPVPAAPEALATAVPADTVEAAAPAIEQNKQAATEKETATWQNKQGKEITNHGMAQKLQNEEKRTERKALKKEDKKGMAPEVAQPIPQPQTEPAQQ